jgi:thiazole synthase
MRLTVNGEDRVFDEGLTVADLLRLLSVSKNRVAVEVNLDVVRSQHLDERTLADGDRVEIISFVGGGAGDVLRLGSHTFHSRLIIGTGKYRDNDQARAVIERSGAEIVTVAVRRLDLSRGGGDGILSAIPPGVRLLPNTAGCTTAEDAIRTAHLAREAGMTDFVKLEVIGDPKTLFPDVPETLKAAAALVKEGFTVLPYVTDDPVASLRLQDMGCAAVMPLGAPIGSGLGIRNPYNLRIILEQAKVPVIVDAGVGTASDAAFALELGVDAVLMNTGIAMARDPVAMAEAMRHGVIAGRTAFLAGRMPARLYATASSPLEGLIARG